MEHYQLGYRSNVACLLIFIDGRKSYQLVIDLVSDPLSNEKERPKGKINSERVIS